MLLYAIKMHMINLTYPPLHEHLFTHLGYGDIRMCFRPPPHNVV